MEILVPIAVLGLLGLAFGLGLAFSAKKFCVVEDSRIAAILNSLPNANCGACGKPGCLGFAESLIQGECSINVCVSTEEEERNKIGRILGVELEKKVQTTAVLHCNGGKKVKNRFVYKGIMSCAASSLVMGGQKECLYGCLGFGDCVKVCPFGAIVMREDGLPEIDESKCKACGRCVEDCPRKLFSLNPINFLYYTNCSSYDLGKEVLSVCRVGCIACRKCQNSCPTKAIEIKNNLAVFDYTKCTNAGECFKVCPTKAIGKQKNISVRVI